MLSALEIIDSLKESMIKADQNPDKHRIDIKNPIFNGHTPSEDNININTLQNTNLTYDHQILFTEKDGLNNNDNTEIIKNIATIRKEKPTMANNNNSLINTTSEMENYKNINNTYDYKSPGKNLKSTTNKKNIQINIPDNVNVTQFTPGAQDKIYTNLNLYSNKSNINNKGFIINNNQNIKQESENNYNKLCIESDKKISQNSKPKFQINPHNNLKSPINNKDNKIPFGQQSSNNNNFNNNDNFQDTVNNIKHSLINGMNYNNSNNQDYTRKNIPKNNFNIPEENNKKNFIVPKGNSKVNIK